MREKEFVDKIRHVQGRAFVVGGWVRDILRRQPPKDKDYVVSGLSEETFCSLFPQAVKAGKSFPVYLLKIDGKHAEVAFARRERKSGTGYTGFAVEFHPGIAIEEDLGRRDTTMNSIAMELPGGEILDPFHGRDDIQQRLIRATSEHFTEDPVRALRAARQAAELQFRIAPKTFSYMRSCAAELQHEPQERILREMRLALSTERPSVFFQSLQAADLLRVTFPEIWAMRGKAQLMYFHPEGDAFAHAMSIVDAVRDVAIEARFAALVHDIGKGLTPREMLPHHYGHEKRGLDALAAWNRRCTLPRLWKSCAEFVIAEHMRAPLLKKKGKIVRLLLSIHRSSLRFSDFNAIIRADHGSLPGYLARGEEYLRAILAVSGRNCPPGLCGAEIGAWVFAEQVRAYGRCAHE